MTDKPFPLLTAKAISETEPSAKRIEPSAKRIEPSAKRIEPSAKQIEPSAKQIEPSAKQIEPSAKQIEPSAKRIEPNTSINSIRMPFGTAEIGAERVEVRTGDFMAFTQNSLPHCMNNSSNEDLVYLQGWTRSITFKAACRAVCVLALTCLAGCTSLPYKSIPGPVGKVTKTTGLPAVTRNNQLYILAKQSQIYIGDIISTDDSSTVSLALVSGQTIDIPPQTRWLVIDVTTNGVDYQSSSSLAQGAFQVKGPGTTPHEFIIHTALAELQTLAGHFWLGYHKGRNAGLTVVAMAAVPVTVRNRNGAITLRAPMQTTTVTPGVAPQSIVNWSEQKLQNTIDYYKQLQ